MSRVERLWAERELPLDALCFRDGKCYGVALPHPDRPGELVIGEAFDLAEELAAADGGGLADAWGYKASVELPGGDRLLAGECVSHGSEGYFARVTADCSLVWAVALGDSNPFIEIRLTGPRATFRSSVGVEVTVDFDDPRQVSDG